MKILDRYIGRAVIGGTLITLAVLLPMVGFFVLADEMDQVGKAGYGMLEALQFVGLSLPRFGYQLFPIATLIGSLMGLGALASRSELVALRAAGVSIGRVVGAALKAGLLLALVAALVGDFVAPQAEQRALVMRSEARYEQVTLKTKYGFWARDGNAYVNIREILPGAILRDISIYEFNDRQELLLSIHAASARYAEDRWVLQDMRQSQIAEEGVEVRRLAETEWGSLLDPALLSVIVAEPHVLPIADLYRYASFLRENGQDARAYEVALWGKVFMPLVVMGMIFLTLPVLFGSTRSSGLGHRVFLGVLAGIGFFLINRTATHLSILYEVSPLLMAIAPTLILLATVGWYTHRGGLGSAQRV